MMLNEEVKPDRKHSSSNTELERGFGARLKEAIGQRSVLSFAKECGISDSLVRKYLAGSLPGLDKALVMARTLDVSLEWLATGQGPGPNAGKKESIYRKVSIEAPQGRTIAESYSAEPAPMPAPGVGLDDLEEVITKVRTMVNQKRPDLSPKAEARIIRLVYEFLLKQGKTLDEAALDNVIELAAFR